jgi:hypothetical protein
MTTSKPYLPAIAATLKALRPILADALQYVDHGLEDAEQGNQNGAAGATIIADEQLKQAAVLTQAIIVLHRQTRRHP